jgi:orotidine-5'-phosphate decarboxylase
MSSSKQALKAKDRLILAVDTSTVDGARRLIDELHEYVGIFKIGLELFMNSGPAILTLFQERNLKLFFDGKFLDIPNTVSRASEAIARAGVQMFTVHATGGAKMLQACAQATIKAAQAADVEPPIILGVTVLTSLDDNMLANELNVRVPVREQVISLAKLCQSSGLTGIVASAEEVGELRAALGQSMVLVTPGVRPKWAETNDQSRIVTPGQALKNGSDYLVIGRPITASGDRREAAKKILDEMDEALSARLAP